MLSWQSHVSSPPECVYLCAALTAYIKQVSVPEKKARTLYTTLSWSNKVFQRSASLFPFAFPVVIMFLFLPFAQSSSALQQTITFLNACWSFHLILWLDICISLCTEALLRQLLLMLLLAVLCMGSFSAHMVYKASISLCNFMFISIATQYTAQSCYCTLAAVFPSLPSAD